MFQIENFKLMSKDTPYRGNSMKLGTGFFLFLLIWTTLAVGQPAQTVGAAKTPAYLLSLSDAVETSLRNNASYGETREKENQADLSTSVTKSILYPNLSLVGQADRQKDANNGFVSNTGRAGSYNEYTTSLRLNQLLYQHGTFATIDTAKKNRALAGFNTEIAQRDLSNSVIQAYYLIVLSSRNIQTLEDQKKIVAESLQVALKRQQTGRGQLLDTLQVKTQFALLEGQLSTAKNQLSEAQTTLASLLGNSTSQEFNIKNTLEAPSVPEIDASIDLKNSRIPEILKDDVAYQQIENQKETLWGQNLPSLNLLGTYNFANEKDSDLFQDSSNSWTIGVQLTIPLFSGLSTVYQDHVLSSQQLQLSLDKKYLQDQVSLQQLNNKKNLETALDSIQTGNEALKLAQASLKEAQRNYKFATIDYLQYLSVQQQLAQAEQSLNTYKYNYITALGNYYSATGQNMKNLIALLEKAQH